ncbi:MAG: AtpZ/AtpI family protein [Candidatus Pacebacteria bacterium]|nr:AtpZ/AtpI family protein [Candidatus Paceibacterota bacterium]
MTKEYNFKTLALSLAGYISASIAGPLVVIGGIGWYLDRLFNSSPKILILSVFVAFIVTNILLFRQLKRINKTIDRYNKEAEEKKLAEEKKDKQELIDTNPSSQAKEQDKTDKNQ